MVTGRDIIEDLVHRMRTESEPLRYSSLAHGVYRVFLNREDYERLAPARRTIVEEASRAMDEEIERINGQRGDASEPLRRWLQAASRLVKPVDPPMRRPAGGWVIELFPDEDEELAPGCFRITSELMLPTHSGGLGGDATHKVQPVAAAPPAPPPVAAPVEPAAPVAPAMTPADATRRTEVSPTTRTARTPWGELTYRDNLGREHTTSLESELVKVGRGGTDTSVDVLIQGPEDVSRVHLHLRRDATSGEVFLKDVSRFGTTLDNERVPPSLEPSGDADRWVPLGGRAQIGLAGVIVLHFRTLG
jgi:hypothetical protein